MRPSALHRYAEFVRSWAHDPRRSRKLRRDLPRWNQINSALDALQQTELAIQAYAAYGDEPPPGLRYLAIYGLLQAMVLQQDAVCHLGEALQQPGTDVTRNHKLDEIRQVRNRSIGHPTKVDRHETTSHHHIARAQLGRGFALHSTFDDGRLQYSYVDLIAMIRTQRHELGKLLRRMAVALGQVQRRRKHAVGLAQSHAARAAKAAAAAAAPARGRLQPAPPPRPGAKHAGMDIGQNRKRKNGNGAAAHLSAKPARGKRNGSAHGNGHALAARQRPGSLRFIQKTPASPGMTLDGVSLAPAGVPLKPALGSGGRVGRS